MVTTGQTRIAPHIMQRIWLNVSNGVGKHGDFLKTFALAYVRADEDNKVKLYSASIAFIEKYKFNEGEYLKEDGI